NWGMICPNETPEGEPVGLVQNFALSACISELLLKVTGKGKHSIYLLYIEESYDLYFGLWPPDESDNTLEAIVIRCEA
ncbi:unnamed protein product, partial [Allacma fusca]